MACLTPVGRPRTSDGHGQFVRTDMDTPLRESVRESFPTRIPAAPKKVSSALGSLCLSSTDDVPLSKIAKSAGLLRTVSHTLPLTAP